MFCLSGSGLKRTQYGILPRLNACMHSPARDVREELKDRGKLNWTRTRLGIPQFDLIVVARAEEASAVVVEGDIADGFRVTHEGSQALALVVDVP